MRSWKKAFSWKVVKVVLKKSYNYKAFAGLEIPLMIGIQG